MPSPMETMNLPYEMNARSIPLASLRLWLPHVGGYFISVRTKWWIHEFFLILSATNAL